MKYFTPQLIARGNSPDPAIVQGVEADWERALRGYGRRWQKIKAAFPREVQRFDEEQVCLHDAQVISMGRQRDTFVMVLQPEAPAQDVVLLTFTLDGEPAIDPQALSGWDASGPVTWLYEEFDLDRSKRCWFEALLSNGWAVKLPFRDFQLLIAQKVFPAAKVPLPPVSTPRSA